MNDRLGIDIVNIERIKKILQNRPNFLKRCFTNEEIIYFQLKKLNPENIASAFACKEALSKAIGIGIFTFGFQNVTLKHEKNGKPFLAFSEIGKSIMEKYGVKFSDVSITHDGGFVIAVVLLQLISIQKKKFYLPPRMNKTHKGSYGRVGVIGGSKGMIGAPFLASLGALRTGAGLVYTYSPSSILNILQIKSLENIIVEIETSEDFFHVKSIEEVLQKSTMIDAMILGPGMGKNTETFSFVHKFITNWDKPLVLDADALNAVQNTGIFEQCPTTPVLTPHPLEFSRMTGLSISEIEARRETVTREFARHTKTVVLLKGHQTIVANELGELYINETGNPGMATAGAGDILSGMIGTLLAQGYPPFEAAKLGAYFHGYAGDLAAKNLGEHGMIASDLLQYIPQAIR